MIKTKRKRYVLSPELIEQNKVSKEAQEELQEVYHELYQVLDKTGQVLAPNVGKPYLTYLANEIEKLEFKLQRLWNFPEDANYHRYWVYHKKCTCPKIDNYERLGYGKIINQECPVHGNGDMI